MALAVTSVVLPETDTFTVDIASRPRTARNSTKWWQQLRDAYVLATSALMFLVHRHVNQYRAGEIRLDQLQLSSVLLSAVDLLFLHYKSGMPTFF